MRTRFLIFAVFAAVAGWQLAACADLDSSSTPSFGDVRIQTLKPYNYAFVSTQTTLNKIDSAAAQLMPTLDAAQDSGKLRSIGPVIFTYHGMTEDRDKPFTVDIGIMVKDAAVAPDGIQIIKVPSIRCATLVYAGPLSQIGQAYGKLYSAIGWHGLQPTGISREVYLFWEDRDSANDVIQIQVDLAVPAAPATPAPTN